MRIETCKNSSQNKPKTYTGDTSLWHSGVYKSGCGYYTVIVKDGQTALFREGEFLGDAGILGHQYTRTHSNPRITAFEFAD